VKSRSQAKVSKQSNPTSPIFQGKTPEQQLYKEQQPTSKTPSVTKRVESGTFTRTIIRRDNKKTVKTTYVKPNPAKVVLGHIGEMEVYVYPYDFPSRVFIGKFPNSTSLEKSDVNALIGFSNQLRWFLDGEPYTRHRMGKAADARRRAILSAYKYAQNASRSQ
jgi:hypothetical protein